MTIQNKIFESFSCPATKDMSFLLLSNCVINKLDFRQLDANFPIVIENCSVTTLFLNNCWFREGLDFINNRVVNDIEFYMGGHNQKPIKICNNIFHGFFDFSDCTFIETLEMRSNIFDMGSNVFGNLSDVARNIFEKKFINENNIGVLNLDGWGK